MKKLFLGLSLLIGTLLFLSCSNDDGYSLNDYWLATGTFIKTSDYYYVITDEGDKLWPSASNILAKKHDDGDRILMNYTILDETEEGSKYKYYVKINNTSAILTKGLFTFTSATSETTKDSIGHNPITIKDTWITDDYLTVEFDYGGGSGIHFISLVKDETALNTDNDEIILELRHNANNDSYNYLQWGLASFDLSEIQKDEQESVGIFVRAIDKNGTYQYNKVLNYEYGAAASNYKLASKVFSNRKTADEIRLK